MSNLEKCLVRAIHAIVRDLSIRGNPEAVQAEIFKAIYPSRHWLFGDRMQSESALRISSVAEACQYLQSLEALEVAVTSCYSIALTGQIIAYAGGLESSLISGLRMQERTLCGHAWLEVSDGKMKQVINPGSELPLDFQVQGQNKPDDMIQSWARRG